MNYTCPKCKTEWNEPITQFIHCPNCDYMVAHYETSGRIEGIKMKVYKKYLTNCKECPNCGYSDFTKLNVCLGSAKASGGFRDLPNSGYNEPIIFPEWCPLEE
jgi:hypothetical protein